MRRSEEVKPGPLWTRGPERGGCPAEGVADLLEPATLRPTGRRGTSVTLGLLLARGTGFLTKFGALMSQGGPRSGASETGQEEDEQSHTRRKAPGRDRHVDQSSVRLVPLQTGLLWTVDKPTPSGVGQDRGRYPACLKPAQTDRSPRHGFYPALENGRSAGRRPEDSGRRLCVAQGLDHSALVVPASHDKTDPVLTEPRPIVGISSYASVAHGIGRRGRWVCCSVVPPWPAAPSRRDARLFCGFLWIPAAAADPHGLVEQSRTW